MPMPEKRVFLKAKRKITPSQPNTSLPENTSAQVQNNGDFKALPQEATDSLNNLSELSQVDEDGKAHFQLAELYQCAIAISTHSEQKFVLLKGAVHSYTIAAGQNYVEAATHLRSVQVQLALCYETGDGVDIDLKEAARLYTLAADQGDETAKQAVIRLSQSFEAEQKSSVMNSCDDMPPKVSEKRIKKKTLLVQQKRKTQQKASSKTTPLLTWVPEIAQTSQDFIRRHLLSAQKHVIIPKKAVKKDTRLARQEQKVTQEEAVPLALITYQKMPHTIEWYQKIRWAILYLYYAVTNWSLLRDVQKNVTTEHKAIDKTHPARRERKVSQTSMRLLTSISSDAEYEKIPDKTTYYKKIRLIILFFYYVAASHKNAEAQYYLGKCHEKGIGVEKNIQKAMRWYKRAAKQGNTKAQHRILWLWKEMSQQGDNHALYNLNKVMRRLQQEASFGNPSAQYNLGLCFEMGGGVSCNYQTALNWYKGAAAQGHEEAIQRMINLLKFQARSEQNAAASFELGQHYEYDEVDKNLSEALYWYQLAARQSNINKSKQTNLDAQYRIGACHEKNKNIQQAISSYEFLAIQGDKRGAQHFIRLLTLQANEKRDAEAQYQLGGCYEGGHWVARNYQAALHLFDLAAKQGHVKAKENFTCLSAKVRKSQQVRSVPHQPLPQPPFIPPRAEVKNLYNAFSPKPSIPKRSALPPRAFGAADAKASYSDYNPKVRNLFTHFSQKATQGETRKMDDKKTKNGLYNS